MKAYSGSEKQSKVPLVEKARYEWMAAAGKESREWKEALDRKVTLRISPVMQIEKTETAPSDLPPCIHFEFFGFLDSGREKGVKQVMLLQGEAGAGKTLALRQLESIFLSQDLPVIYADLKKLEHPFKDCVGEVLRGYGLSQGMVEAVKTSGIKFLLLLDGFESLNRFSNLLKSNNLEGWNCNVVITCTPSYLGQIPDYRDHFELPTFNLIERYLVPLSDAQQGQIIKNFKNPKKSSTLDDIAEDLGSLALSDSSATKKIKVSPETGQLFRIPLFFSSLLHLFTRRSSEESKFVSNATAFSVITQAFFDHKRRESSNSLQLETLRNPVENFELLSRLIAMEMFVQGCSEFSLPDDIPISKGPFDRFFEPKTEKYLRGLFLRFGGKKKKFQCSSSSPSFQIRREGVPQVIRNGKFQFIHPDLQAYFIAKHLNMELTKLLDSRTTPSGDSILNMKLVSDSPVVERFLQELLQENLPAPSVVVNLIKSHKNLATFCTNLVVILNHAGMSFYGFDLSGLDFRGTRTFFSLITNQLSPFL